MSTRPWPEGVDPAPELAAAWLLEHADAAEVVAFVTRALDNSRMAHRCFLENHDGLRDELQLLRELVHAQSWHRDVTGYAVCSCTHLEQEHRHDLKTSSPCHVGGCPCDRLDPVATRWREHRTVTVPLPSTVAPCPHHRSAAPPAASATTATPTERGI